MNREFNLFVLWEMERIFGAADKTQQHGAVMAFITIKFSGHLWPQQVTCPHVTYMYGNTPYRPIVAAFLVELLLLLVDKKRR